MYKRQELIIVSGFMFFLSLSFIASLLLFDLGIKYALNWLFLSSDNGGIWKRLIIGATHLIITYVVFEFYGIFEIFFAKFELLNMCIVVCVLLDLFFGFHKLRKYAK